jgi:hypothetical protein
MTVTLEIDLTPERAQKAVGMMREVKAFYEKTADTRLKQNALTLVQAAERLEPIADALLMVGALELALTEAAEPGLDQVEEYAYLAAEPAAAARAAVKDVAAENEAECGDCSVPRCRFCDQPGTRAGGLKDAGGRMTERFYVCKTAGCAAASIKVPQPARLFTGGAE